MSERDQLKTTLRLPAAFAAEATAYADSLGISLNSLLSVALRQFLDRAKLAATLPTDAHSAAQPLAIPMPAGSAGSHRAALDSETSSVPKVAKGQPCPCGSRKTYGKCHGRMS